MNSFCSELNTISPKLHAMLSSSLEEIRKGRYTLGDKLQQHVAATYHSMCTGRATSCSNKVRRHVAATNRFVCTGGFCENLCLRNKILSLQQVAKNQIRLNLSALLRRPKFCCSDKDFHKFIQYKRSDLSLQRVAATCCCNLSPSVY